MKPTTHAVWIALVGLLTTTPLRAETERDRFSAGGYFRVMTRPDFQGGNSRLGLWNLHGRLLNEGPWAALELKLDLLQRRPGRNKIWTSVHTKLEGGSVANADSLGGWLGAYKTTQLYVEAGNVLLNDVTWQVGTLYTYFGDLGLYDMRPAEIFFDTLGLSARYDVQKLEILLGAGDAGYFIRGDQYNTIFTGGGYARLRLGDHFELGAGGQAYYEPKVRGNRFAPHQTPNATYLDFYRGEIAQNFFRQNPEAQRLTHRPSDAQSFKLVAYLGFGKLGPIRWNNLFANYLRRHPDNFVTESYAGTDYNIYVKSLTDERYEINVGNEMQIDLIQGRLDAVWGILYGHHTNRDNAEVVNEENRTLYSTVLRLQLYLTPTVHLLLESSLAREEAHLGNLWREHHDSLFQNDGQQASSLGLQFGDTNQRNTWQLKSGIVLNPLGTGIYSRPSLRLLYGLQYSNTHAAFGNSFPANPDQFNQFEVRRDRHWHSVIALEAEAWF